MKSRLVYLDGLKAILTFGIVLFHYSARVSHNADQLPFPSMEALTYLVEVFFVISGFLAAKSYQLRLGGMPFSSFMVNRLKQLYFPAAYAVLLGGIDKLLRMVIWGEGSVTVWALFTSLTMTSTGYLENKLPLSAPVWYIGVLILCYGCYYLVCKAEKRHPGSYLYFCAGFVFLGAVCILKSPDLPLLFRHNGRGYCCFFLGVLLLEIQNCEKLNKRQIGIIGEVLIALVMGLSLIFGKEKVFGQVGLSAAIILAPTFVFCVINLRWVQRILETKVLLMIGKLNMAVFLTHLPVLGLVWSINRFFDLGGRTDSITYFLIALAAVYLFALLWVWIVERKLIPATGPFLRKLFFNDFSTEKNVV